MSTYQKFTAVGNVGNDPETRELPNGGMVSNVSLATTESWKDKNTGEKKELTEWHRVVFFNRLAEIVNQYVEKGDKLLVEGTLRTNKWKDKEGNDRYTTEVIAKEMKMLGGSGASEPRNSSNGNTSGTAGEDRVPRNDEIADDDIPF